MSNYKDIVKEAKCLYSKIEGYQKRIAELAVKACTIRHGGRSNGFYTLTDFANDTGVPYKTLQNWVRVYRNVVEKLPPEKQASTAANWTKASRTLAIIKSENRSKNKLNGKSGSKQLKPTRSSKRVEKIFDSIGDPKCFQAKFLDFIASQRHLTFCLKSLDMSSVTDEEWIDLMERLDENSELVNDYLTQKKKRRA